MDRYGREASTSGVSLLWHLEEEQERWLCNVVVELCCLV